MLNIGITFEVLPEVKKAPPGWNKVTGYLVYDVKNGFHKESQMGARWT